MKTTITAILGLAAFAAITTDHKSQSVIYFESSGLAVISED